jgi:GTP-sensing pleiotropic transcriptional regulator CodY
MSRTNPRLQTTADKNDLNKDVLTEAARRLESAGVSSNSRRLAALLQNPNELSL